MRFRTLVKVPRRRRVRVISAHQRSTRFSHELVTKGCSEAADASASGSIRHRPTPFGAWISTAMPVSTFLPLARPPASPGSSPPMGFA